MNAFSPISPTGAGIVRFLAERPEFAGVGRTTANKLWANFGPDLYRILGSGDAERLAEVLPQTQAEIVCDAWRHQQALADCVVFFDEHGIDGTVARKAAAFWGDQAVAKLKDNPYRLLTVCPWNQVDDMARALRFAADDARRLIGAVDAALYERLDGKHTATPEPFLLRTVAKLLRCGRDAAVAAVRAAVEDGAALPSAAGLQPAGAAHMERYIEARLRSMIDRPARQEDLLATQVSRGQVQEYLEGQVGPGGDRLTDEQREAVCGAMCARFFVLTGGAGVGKTTCLRAINAAATRFGQHVYQLALAGRAAQRMAEATGRPAQTIAGWMKAAAEGKAETGAHSLVIVDEASMLDLPTTYRLLFHMHEDARLVLVGDVAQLPPIGFGLVLHRLVDSPIVPKVELTRILRATEASGIPAVSRAIRDGVVPHLPDWEPGIAGCSFLEAATEEMIGAVERARLDGAATDEVQVVGPIYGGPAGIDAVNAHFHKENVRECSVAGRFAPGDPVIWTTNDRAKELWNGSMGVVEAVGQAGLRVTLDGRMVELASEDLEKLELAYAISTHKAQGSQFATVIVLIVRSRPLDRTLLYTALTRATQRVVLVGSRLVFEEAVRRPPVSLARVVALSLAAPTDAP